MASRVPVLLTNAPYEVIVGNDILASSGEFIRRVLPVGKCALITDSNIAPLYAETVRNSLERAGFAVITVVVPAGEKSKSLSQTESVCNELIAGGLDRHAHVVGLGGGVVGDLAGFVASVYHRGIPHVQIPTTVVAQVDSSIGGKTGVNAGRGKNLIGSFHQPSLVVADCATLETLPKREFDEGMAEIIKHAAIRDAGMFDEIENLSRAELPTLIARNVKIKALIVVEDERETSDLRALLNFGHTIGHAIENAAGYGRYLHGEAISLGLAAALHLSVKKAGLPQKDADRVRAALEMFHLPLQLPEDITTADLLAALRLDKKFREGAIRFVLTESLGSAFVSDKITMDDLRDAIEALRK
jgi:3-dehydroquinate synthase